MPTVKLKKTKWTDQMFLAAVLYSSPPEGLRLTHLTGEPTLSSISSRLPCYSCNPHKPSFQNCNFGHKTINKTEMQRRRLASLLQPTLPTCTCQSAMVKHPRILAGTGAEMLIILITSSAFPPSLEKSMNNLALLRVVWNVCSQKVMGTRQGLENTVTCKVAGCHRDIPLSSTSMVQKS